MSSDELKLICAGEIKASLITALVSAFKFVLELGRALGSSLRRYTTNNAC